MRSSSFLFFSFFLLLSLPEVAFANEMVEVFAKHVVATPKHFLATDDVVILYDGAVIKSDMATYDKNSSLLTLEGDVEMIGLEDNRVASNKLVIDTSTKSVTFKKLFLTGKENLWIDSPSATKENSHYKLFKSRVSSCDTANPDWTIEFDEAHYREDKNFITLKDAKLKFYNNTVFYFPYLAFPTNTKRTSGLLLPQTRFSAKDGFTYQQPYFYVPSNNVDIEFNPQFRTTRGFGGHVTTRFVDSNHSEGYFRAGYFKNNQAYANANDLNKEHYGGELFYQSSDFLPDVLTQKGYKNGLYANITHLNDREYLNVQQANASSLVSSTLIESRLNAFTYDERNYFGLYGKYYIDTSLSDNRDTIQDLPTLQYHRYMQHLISNKLFYSFDAKAHNYTRARGSSAIQSEIDLPLTYYDAFFDDYLDFSLSENLYLSKVAFRNLTSQGENYRYYRNYHTMELSSDLSKSYDGSVHTLHPSLIYTRPSLENENPTNYENLSQEQQELFAIHTQEEQIALSLAQYYYSNSLEMNLFHRFGYSQFPNRTASKGDFHNEMGYNNENLSIYSNLFYSWNEKRVHSLTSSIGYNQSNYDIMLTHFYNNDFLFDDKKTSFLSTEFIHNYTTSNQWFVSYDYDLEASFNHKWELGWGHQQKCWSARVSIGESLIPNLNSSFKNTTLYFELNLNPLGGIKQNIEQQFSAEGT